MLFEGGSVLVSISTVIVLFWHFTVRVVTQFISPLVVSSYTEPPTDSSRWYVRMVALPNTLPVDGWCADLRSIVGQPGKKFYVQTCSNKFHWGPSSFFNDFYTLLNAKLKHANAQLDTSIWLFLTFRLHVHNAFNQNPFTYLFSSIFLEMMLIILHPFVYNKCMKTLKVVSGHTWWKIK